MRAISRWFGALLLAAAGPASVAQMMPMTPSYQGLWWNAPAGSESGWGVNLTHQGNILFATWFTYDMDGKGMWLVMPRGDLQPMMMNPCGYGCADMAHQPAYTGTPSRTTGPAFDAMPWNSAQVTATPVGTATFTFNDATSGTFTAVVDGAAQSKPITRQVYAAPVTACRP